MRKYELAPTTELRTTPRIGTNTSASETASAARRVPTIMLTSVARALFTNAIGDSVSLGAELPICSAMRGGRTN
eukprot:CAMPEP_0204219938 /NCGR_PEP_ID=MMETSP0361-20130328/80654_1 /ASSEMBLY_ACC=CAM_ASM_000343 /TAXON_ID=268821 /ORGANISM="Scrippsiella Hangoei, Strain SHTV-5" /LENGTH=73 /DNA_ID=CAMNT_0051185291 /DNA_START=221 /DNA_END=442 /DNA_ORIENTATION=+